MYLSVNISIQVWNTCDSIQLLLICLLFRTFVTTPTTAPEPLCSVTPLSLCILRYLLSISYPMIPLSPRSYRWDVYTVRCVLLTPSTMTSVRRLNLRLHRRTSTCRIPRFRMSTIMIIWNLFSNTLYCSIVVNGDECRWWWSWNPNNYEIV